jgi:predicted KAP-like P-loop ATPase
MALRPLRLGASPGSIGSSCDDALVTQPEHRDLTIDAPIEDFANDRFARGPFARRIARTIIAQRDPGSLVVGVYGPWGDGKTSVLNLVERTLAEDPTVVAVRFNPWQLGNEDQVFRGNSATRIKSSEGSSPS